MYKKISDLGYPEPIFRKLKMYRKINKPSETKTENKTTEEFGVYLNNNIR